MRSLPMRKLLATEKGLKVYTPPEDPLPGAEVAKRRRAIRGAVVYVTLLSTLVMAAIVAVVGKYVANLLGGAPPGPGRALVALVLVGGGVLASCLAGAGLSWLLGRRLGAAYGAYLDWYDEKQNGKNEGSGA